jgi:acetyltransferase-like isoleucine patch superfamily enzyme
MVTGDAGFAAFLRYEMVFSLCVGIPGALGVGLRRWLYRGLFKGMGRRVTFGRNVALRRPGDITLGDGVVVGDNAFLNVKADEGEIVIGNRVSIGPGCLVSCTGAQLVIKEDAKIEERCRLGSLQGLEVGARVKVGAECCFTGAGHAYDRLDVPMIMQPLTCRGKTTIGDDVAIGPKSVIFDGVTVGAGAEIGEGSLVNKDVAAGKRVQGVPAQPEGTA